MSATMEDAMPVPGLRYARAKVNLGLAVTASRPNGYHELRSIFLRVGMSDRVQARSIPGGFDSLSIGGDPDCPVDGNLVLRAAAELRTRLAEDLPPLAFRLQKVIPMDAGLGGGSADAAAALDVAAEAWGIDLDPEVRHAAAAGLGADVPFLASGVAGALVGGVGELLEPLPAVPGLGLLLVSPRLRLGTRSVFGAFDSIAPMGRAEESATVVENLASALRSGMDGPALAEWAPVLRDANDLWPAAVAISPMLAEVRTTLEEQLARPVLMTGSGSTLFCLYPSSADAADAGQALAALALPELAGARFASVDETGPDPAWRFP